MRLQADGDLEVSLGETITVEIEAFDTALLAHAGAIQLGQWSSVDQVSASREVRRFSPSSTFSTNFSFGIGFDFSPGPAGPISPMARYKVRITGNGPGAFERERIIRPAAILPTVRIFSFEVGHG
jgi:hypothetical protein